jgi:N-acetylmuramoyl-L-alanine amidase
MRWSRPHRGFVLIFLIIGLYPLRFPALASVDGPETLYESARRAYQRLKESRERQHYRSNWVKCIDRFDQVYQNFPESNRADDALFMMGRLYEGLYRYSSRQMDLALAISAYQRLTVLYPSSNLADDGQFRIGTIHLRNEDFEQAYVNFSKVEERFPRGDMVREAQREMARLKKHRPKERALVHVMGIRHWSSTDYTRVVIDLDGETVFEDHVLRKDPDQNKPPRLYVDIKSSSISPDLTQPIAIQDGLLTKARAAQHSQEVVRVVLDMESLSTYRAFPLKDPARIIIDVHGNGKKAQSPGDANRSLSKTPLPQQLGLGVRRVVIDPGHGGKDPGAIGRGGLREKTVVLKIAKALEKKLKKELGLETVLTRRGDRFVSLDERTAIANTRKADLFVSIHANASRRGGARGIETYVLNFATDEKSMALAARENAISTKKLSDLQYILYDLMRTAKIGESRTLAEHTQRSIYQRLRTKYPGIRNLGVKEAPFYVLIGANMPSILVEVSFISNRTEERRLRDDRYLEELASGIMEGIEKYVRQIGEMATL